MRRFPEVLILVVIFLLTSSLDAATIYKWVDKKGVVNFTDDIRNVPREYRDEVKVKELILEGGSPVESLEVRTGAKEETRKGIRTDIYGRDESYWGGRVRPWKDQLEQAQANYQGTQEKFMKAAEEPSQMRYGSRTQYKTKIIELDRLNQELKKYEDKIAEANEMLEKISKEVREAKANPDWLKD
jgi:chromosome segregation ATPase